MNLYSDFLKSKQVRTLSRGFDVPEESLNRNAW